MGISRYLLAIALVLMVVIPLGIATAAALEAKTDKARYIPGEEVIVSGKATPGAVVTIRVEGPKGLVTAKQVKAGSDGSFSVVVMKFPEEPSDIIPYGTYRIVVKDSVTLETVELEIEFVGFGVKGVVVDEEGKPIANACVELTINETVVETKTKTDGSFVIYATKIGTGTLKIAKAGYMSKEVSVTVEIGKVVDVGTIVLESMESVIEELSSKLASLEVVVSNINKSVVSLSKSLSELEARVGGIEIAFNAINKSLEDIKKSLSDVGTAITDIASAIKALGESLGKTIDEKIGSVMERLSTVESELAKAIDEKASDVGKKVDDVMTKVASVAADVAAVKSDIASVKSDIASVTRSVSEVKSAVDDVRSTIKEAESKILSTIESKVGDLGSKVDKAKGDLLAKMDSTK
ncbi:MAG TPA: hypothetical protein ENF93_02085, partial [Ignisphaera sp.]|nr:hypothetical protein [Ignisphaera sp.]